MLYELKILLLKLLSFQTRELVQAHVQYGVGLYLRQLELGS